MLFRSRIVIGRSGAVEGPYYSADTVPMLLGGSTGLLMPNTAFPVLGQCCAIVDADEEGGWILFQAAPGSLMLSPYRWHSAWPVVAGQSPATRCIAPVFDE